MREITLSGEEILIIFLKMHKGVHVACFHCNLSNSGESGVGVFLLVFFTFVLESVFGDMEHLLKHYI